MLNSLSRRSQIFLLCLFLSSVALATGIQQFDVADDHGGNSECALLLEGPGRSSAYDYNLNTLRGTPGYGGPHTCITYDAVNNAYVQARKYVRVVERRERYEHPELATVGELLLEISRILSRTYGLSVDEIEHGLPLIDTSKTLVREVCPAFLSNVHCQPGKYRRYDGLCNNLKHPTWGSVQSTFARLLKPVYADSISDPRIGTHGSTLPPPRIVSRTIHPDEGYHDHAATILIISWGQFMDHDLTLTATPLDPLTRNEPEECCHRPPNARNPYCLQIDIPHDDPFYGVYGVRCIDFVRGFPGVRAGCRLGSRNQFNILTAVIDGNTVYGVEENFARSLRSGYGGLLRMNPVFAQYGLHDLLPLKLDIPDEGCTRPNRSMYCFDAGEIRVNEQLVLTCMHTLMAREHNRIAHKLGEINPHWDDETIYQEGRRIVVAEIQHITYNEFLPLLLGKEVMAKFGLLLQKEGYWDGYDQNVNPSVLASFSAAAFRFGHSLLPTNVERWSKAHKFIASRRLRDLIRQPFDLYRAGVIDEYFMGMANQVAQAMDDSVTQEVTNHLFRKPNQPFGVDLAAFNMQRGREFGLPSYMEFRKYCGLPGAEGWDDLFGSMNNITVKRYAQIYVHPQDIDLWSGGVSERPLPGAMVGPTFACIIASQFSNARRGDRFWYELGGLPHSFSQDQLTELRKSRLARIVCDNTDLIDTIQLYPMVLPDHEINPRVPCRSGVLLNIDLSKWADYGGQYSHSAPVHTDSLSLGGYENDPSIGKYVNQDGLQQLRHYLKVGPYRAGLSGQASSNPFFGYLRQVLTRRPVTLIHSTKGHDASNIANVHYSPEPEHEELPAPGVDHSPRGFPSFGGGLPLGKHGRKPILGPLTEILPEDKPFFGGPGPLKPEGDYNSHPKLNLQISNAFDEPNPVKNVIAYGAPSWPFNTPGPLKIYYGFKPVATPYGNISISGEYGSDIKRYAPAEFSQNFLDEKLNYKRSVHNDKENAVDKQASAYYEYEGDKNEHDNPIRQKIGRNKRNAEELPAEALGMNINADENVVYRIRLLPEQTREQVIVSDSAEVVKGSAGNPKTTPTPSKNLELPAQKMKEKDNKDKNADAVAEESEKEDLRKTGNTKGAINETTLSNQKVEAQSYIKGLQNAVISTALDLAVGLTEMTREWLSSVRFSFGQVDGNNRSERTFSNANSSTFNESTSNDGNRTQFSNSDSNLTDVDSTVSQTDSQTSNRNNFTIPSIVIQTNASTDPRKILVRKYFSLLRNIVKDVRETVEERIQSS